MPPSDSALRSTHSRCARPYGIVLVSPPLSVSSVPCHLPHAYLEMDVHAHRGLVPGIALHASMRRILSCMVSLRIIPIPGSEALLREQRAHLEDRGERISCPAFLAAHRFLLRKRYHDGFPWSIFNTCMYAIIVSLPTILYFTFTCRTGEMQLDDESKCMSLSLLYPVR
jgi:hypothetical protein